MEVRFGVKGANEKELRDKARTVLNAFVDSVSQGWSYTMEADAVQDETGRITSWAGKVTATKEESREVE